MPQSTPPSPLSGPYANGIPSRGPALIAGSVTLTVVASIAVALRLVARRLKKLSWAADDYLAIMALVFAYGMFTSLIYCIKNGLGERIVTDIPSALRASRWLYIFEALFPVTTIATKLSILYLYKRIFSTFNRMFAWSLYTVTALQVGWAISGFFTTVFQCWPIDILWRLKGGIFSAHPAGHCIDLVASLTGLATINTVLNTALLILPMPMVWQLHTSRKHKIALSAIFALGCADISASIARTYITSQAINDPSSALWRQAPAVILSFVEPCVGIICACLPTMRPLLSATEDLASNIFGKPSGSSWAPLRGRSSHSGDVSGSNETCGGHATLEPTMVGSVNMPEAKGPLVASMVHGGFSSQWPLVDEEQARQGITVKTELDQNATRS